MRLLYVIDSLAAGGAETSLAAMAPHLKRLGIDLEVAWFVDRRDLYERLADAGARMLPLTEAGNRRTRAFAVRDVVRARKPDLVHTTLFEADLAGRVGARLGGAPSVSTLANEMYGPSHLADPGVRAHRLRAAQSLDAATARLACRLHATSMPVAKTMSRRLRYPFDRIDVINRGRDAAALGRRTVERRERVRRGLGIESDTPVILGVGRREHQKGFDIVIEAMAAVLETLPATVLLVAGRDGAQSESLNAQVAAAGLGDSVRFLGHREDVADLMVAADVLAFPSRREGFPGTVAEALALECPIVASDIGQVREAVGDHDPVATLVPPDDALALGAALARTLRSPDLAADVARRGRQRFLDRFAIEGVTDQMAAFYERVLRARGLR